MHKPYDNETTSGDTKPPESMNQFSVESMDQVNDANETNETTEWTNSTCSNLQQMNVHCLLEIFSASSLDRMDLCSIADTCKLFRQIIPRVVPKDIDVWAENGSTEYNLKSRISCKRTVNDIARIFKKFGSILSTVGIGGPFDTEILQYENGFLVNLIADYCNDDKLKSLSIRKIEISDVLSVKLKPIFQQLQCLHLWGMSVPADATTFAKLDSVVELHTIRVQNCSAILENVFPKLERFEYTETCAECETGINEHTLDTLSAFVARHNKLTKLHLDAICNDSYRATILQVISNSCAKLEDLKLFDHAGAFHQTDTVGFDVQSLPTLKSLKSLLLWKVTFKDFRAFSSLTELRELVLVFCQLPKDSAQFACCSQLTNLGMCSFGESLDVVDMISRLTNLKDLGIGYPLTLDEETFTKIVSVVEGRPNVLKLICQFHFTAPKHDKTRRVRLFLWD